MIGGSVVSRLYGIALSAETPFKLHWSPLKYLLPFAFAAAKAALCCYCCCNLLRFGSFCPPSPPRSRRLLAALFPASNGILASFVWPLWLLRG